MTASLAVFDLGKTNSKLFVFSPDGTILDERRTKPVWRRFRGRMVLDDDHLYAWMTRELADVVTAHGVSAVMISAHACTFALVDEKKLLHPILDYEQEIPTGVASVIDPKLPEFSETFTPILPLGFSIARHLYWLEAEEPALFEKTKSILFYPQYWVWRFTGKRLAELSYLAAHNQLWAPTLQDYSSLVDGMGWRNKFPELAPAGSIVGKAKIVLADGAERQLAVHNGVHDSNAALAYYRTTGLTNFSLVSTGTWVIVINPDCPLRLLDGDRDMLANVTVRGEPAPTIRFMGGREFDLLRAGWSGPISQAAVIRVIDRGVFAVPSFAAGGPFLGLTGHVIGGELRGEERAAMALLYVVMMTDLSLELIKSEDLIVLDGGLAKIDLFAEMVAQLRPSQTVVRSTTSEGSAAGAAALAFESIGISPFQDETVPVTASNFRDLAAYRGRWRRLADDARASMRRPSIGSSVDAL